MNKYKFGDVKKGKLDAVKIIKVKYKEIRK